MASFPNFSNVSQYVVDELESRKGNNSKLSQMNAWIRVASAAGGGCQLISNPNFSLFGDSSIYGLNNLSGTIGTSWDGKTPILAEGEQMGFRPKPNITSIEIDEGAGNLSRKASFTITCYTKAQLDQVCKYFLEPGYTIFLEWGWNTGLGVSQYTPSLDPVSVSKFQSFINVNTARNNSGGHYDNYLGFITGGSIALNGDTWDVNVKCTGFTELPAYLMVTDKVDEKTSTEEAVSKESARAYLPAEIDAQSGNLGKQRFMMMFNRLPSNRLSKRVASLIDAPDVAHPVNFINVDETVKENIADNMDGWSIAGFQLKAGSAETEGADVKLPDGTKIVGDESYIRFGALIRIINKIIEGGFKLKDGTKINLAINTSRSICGAFPKIFSTDKSKLFIPNKTSPKFSLLHASTSTTPQDSFVEEADNSVTVTDGGTTRTIMFPLDTDLVDGVATRDGQKVQVQRGIGSASLLKLNKAAKTYGFLDDLYVNIDFAKGILETKNFSVKDALYQLLNGMSSAAGALWDFNIIESPDGKELYVVDLNCVAQNEKTTPVQLELMGVNSIFMDASLDLDISGAKMNQVIGNRLSKKLNSSQPETNGKQKGLFSDMDDLILVQLESTQAVQEDTQQSGTTTTPAEQKKIDDEAKEKNMSIFLNKIGYAPKANVKEGEVTSNLDEMLYVCAFNDQAIFESLKIRQDVVKRNTESEVSPLMPIKFTGVMHGISGFKRGDKFIVKGLPKQYENTGFFQVTAVKQTIEGMLWKTEIEGGFRKLIGI